VALSGLSLLAATLGDKIVAIEHVGSTSVPGLAAKPVIDVDVVIESPQRLAAVIERLARLGYERLGDLGVTGREAFAAPESLDSDVEPLAVHQHLYVVCMHSAQLSAHIVFRAALRADDALACEYAALKRRLAGEFGHDREGYTRGKTAFGNR
jgi:GrpB-like predicted nucleotidyltransferase (UPF0157 family)